MGLAILSITVGSVVSLVLLVLRIHPGNVFIASLYSDFLNGERCIQREDCWIDWCEGCTIWVSSFGQRCDLLKLGVLGIADVLLPVIRMIVRVGVVMTACFPMASAQIVFAICMRKVSGGGLVFWHVCSEKRHGTVIAGDGVRGSRSCRSSVWSSVVDTFWNEVLFLCRCAYPCIVPGDSISYNILLTSCMYYSLVETCKKLLPMAQFPWPLCSIHDCPKWLVISQDGEPSFSRLSFQKLYQIDHC